MWYGESISIDSYRFLCKINCPKLGSRKYNDRQAGSPKQSYIHWKISPETITGKNMSVRLRVSAHMPICWSKVYYVKERSYIAIPQRLHEKEA